MSVATIGRRLAGLHRRPAILLLVLLAVPAAASFTILLASRAATDLGATALLVALAAGSGVLLLAVFARLAGGTIPRPAAMAALAWGSLAAPLVAAPADGLWGEIAAAIIGGTPDTGWAGPITAGPVEEVTKLLGVALVAVAWPRSVRDARSGLLMGLLVGLGFGATEDGLYLASIIRVGATDPIEVIGLLFGVRTVASGLYLHAAFTGIAGLALGWTLGQPSLGRWAATIGAAGLATSLHVLANVGPVMPPDLPWQTDDLPTVTAVALVRSVPFAVVIWLLVRLKETPLRDRLEPRSEVT